MSFGRCYEEFEIGAVYRHWPGRTINESDIAWFALLSMNQHPLYVDQHYAREQGYSRLPVPDTLLFSIAVGLSVADTSGQAIANLGFERVVFEAPAYQGDSIYAESEVLEKRESASKSDRGLIYIETRAFNQNRERVLTLRRRFLTPKRG